MNPRQQHIIEQLQITAPFTGADDIQAQIDRRIGFIQNTLRGSGLKTLVLGISGGIDSTVAGRLAQLAVEDLRAQSGDARYQFIAVRLPYLNQFDEADAQAALAFIRADQTRSVNIGASVQALAAQLDDLAALTDSARDRVLGNVKARLRMVAQFAIANAHNGLVIGTDHAAEAVMGFFTKFGDGACDLAPLTGLVKNQVRAIGSHLGAPQTLVFKTPTADLEDGAPGKPDELAYGVSYAQIDAFLHGQRIDPAAEQRIIATFDASQHKRAMPLTP
ncbi:ammonia-dependent NAD(+) synthetase [Sinimarinibacterium sp. NLF-5-8]|uniref:ammonia-dependent NAD(+) synthetase n=1 Tax=Sinimarinibacterium sp. NLF-5-8 TaxID=2698684 RepID=UPI00137BD715|nr:ammonia-dependent NAD(+) synthetase [Sinimarinibacterium sp. NLF-5-8]QHS09536.1 ammonia-dependent NAD(+) synthetase [Sinimarinibacterium sp. NLF-5-8]